MIDWNNLLEIRENVADVQEFVPGISSVVKACLRCCISSADFALSFEERLKASEISAAAIQEGYVERDHSQQKNFLEAVISACEANRNPETTKIAMEALRSFMLLNVSHDVKTRLPR